MKIFFVNATMDAGGAERTIANLSNFFNQVGHDVTIVTLCDSTPAYKLMSGVNYINNETLISKNIYEAIKNNYSQIKRLKKLIKMEKPDTIICFSITALFISVIANIFSKTKIIYSERSNPYTFMQGTVWKKIKKPLSIMADGCIFQTERAKNYYPKITQKKSTVIRNPVYLEDYKNIPHSFMRDKVVVSVGRLIDTKGFDVLIKAFSSVNKKYPEYKLKIYGDGPEKNNLKNLVQALNIEDAVLFEGFVKSVPSVIYNASLFVFSSRLEGMPNALLEAMACGLPCVSTDCEMGPRELIINKKNGILVPVDDEIEMAEAMCEIISSSNHSKRLSKEAKKVRNTNNLTIIGKQILDYIQKV